MAHSFTVLALMQSVVVLYIAVISALALYGDASAASPESLSDDDFIVVIGSTTSRLVLAQATRAWRTGIRTYIATNTTEDAEAYTALYADLKEYYGFFPDEAENDKANWKANYAGDLRAGFAPWLAHKFFKGNYKWLLYGDDDTLFFMPGVRRLVSQFDHNVPLALSDNLWWKANHPKLEAARCVPCGFNTSVIVSEEQKRLFIPKAECPYCTRDAACPENKKHTRNCEFAGAHGGAGVVVSVELMRRISYDAALACMNKIYGCSGSDCLFSSCIWEAGFGFTDPGYSLK